MFMASFKSFEDIAAWQKAREIAININELIKKDSFSHDPSLKNQIRKSSGSIMDNIAEGFERGGNKEFVQFLSISKGSCRELKSQLYRCLDLQFIKDQDFKDIYDQVDELEGKLYRLMSYLKKTSFRGPKFRT